MKLCAVLMTSAFLTVGAGMAQADCAADLASLETETSAGSGSEGSSNQIAKDGSTAPLEASGTAASSQSAPDSSAAGDAAATRNAAGNEIAKDGSTAPLEPAGEGTAVATSGQDVVAQQDGGPTAAQQAAEDGVEDAAPATRAAALYNARTALAAGDEAACMEAMEQARGL